MFRWRRRGDVAGEDAEDLEDVADAVPDREEPAADGTPDDGTGRDPAGTDGGSDRHGADALLGERGPMLFGPSARSGAFVAGFVPVPTTLTVREAAWLEAARRRRAEGGGTGRPPAHALRRRDLRAVEEAAGLAAKAGTARLAGERDREAERETRIAGQLPTGSVAPWSMLSRDFTARPLVPFHQTSIARSGVLTTLVAGSGAPQAVVRLRDGSVVDCPPVGVDVFTDELFRFDPWACYDMGWTRSADVFLSGLRGTGKSFDAKCMAVRQIEFGRRVIVQSDRQGEWARVARLVGGQVVSPSRDRCLNPFELPAMPDGMRDPEWESTVMTIRAKAFHTLAEAIGDDRGEYPFDHDQDTLVDAVVKSFGTGPMTLGAAVDRLKDPEWVGRIAAGLDGFERYVSLAQDKAAGAARILSIMTNGTYAGYFDGESTVRPDPSNPMIVFDTSSQAFDNAKLKRVYLAMTSTWIDTLLQRRDGMRRNIVLEEAWDILPHRNLTESLQTRAKSAGHWGCSTWIIVHGVSDMRDVFDEGTRLKSMAAELLKLTEIRVVHRQDVSREFRAVFPGMPDEVAALVPGLPEGVGLWMLGRQPVRMVRAVVGPTLSEVFDTSMLRHAA